MDINKKNKNPNHNINEPRPGEIGPYKNYNGTH